MRWRGRSRHSRRLRIESREWYEPTPETVQTRKDGERTGALKSETIKYGQPDWSGNKTFSLFSW